MVAESFVPVVAAQSINTSSNIVNWRLKMTVEIGAKLTCVKFSHFLRPKHSQACKINSKITFFDKESIGNLIVNFQREKRNLVK